MRQKCCLLTMYLYLALPISNIYPTSSFALDVFSSLQHLDTQQKQILGVTLSSIWKHGNNKVWNDTIEPVSMICEPESTVFNSLSMPNLSGPLSLIRLLTVRQLSDENKVWVVISVIWTLFLSCVK